MASTSGSRPGAGKKNTSSSSRAGKSQKKNTGSRSVSASRKPETENAITNEIILIGVFALCVLFFLCNFGIIGPVGNAVSGCMFGIFGMIAYIVPILIFGGLAFGMSNQGNFFADLKIVASVVLLLLVGVVLELVGGQVSSMEKYSISLLYTVSAQTKAGGGVLSGSLAYLMNHFLGMVGAVLLVLVLAIICLVVITEKSFVGGVKKQSRRVYESAREDARVRKERAQRRREEQQSRREEELAKREEEKARREAEKILRMDKKVSGVMIDTTLSVKGAKMQEEAAQTGQFREWDGEAGQYQETVLGGIRPQRREETRNETSNENIVDFSRIRIHMSAKEELEMRPEGKEPEREAAADKEGNMLQPDRPEDPLAAAYGNADVFRDMRAITPSRIGRQPAPDFVAQIAEIQDAGKVAMGQTAGNVMEAAALGAGIDLASRAGAAGGRNLTMSVTSGTENAWTAAYDLGGENGSAASDVPKAVVSGQADEGIQFQKKTVSPQKEEMAFEEAGIRMISAMEETTFAGSGKNDEEESVPWEDGEKLEPVLGREGNEVVLSEESWESSEIPARGENGREAPLLQEEKRMASSVSERPKAVLTRPKQATQPQTPGAAAVEALKKEGVISSKPKEPPRPYRFPPISLLKETGSRNNPDAVRELKNTAVKLQQTLATFGVKVTITDISQGPTVTRYELQPEQGVKVSKILGLSDDIKLNLAATDIRIEAPIPGKAAVGIEVPNKENIVVGLRELFESREFRDFPSRIAFAVGKDIAGKVVVSDIAKMPHMLIAGSTGSGKSVCINTLIMSILYKAKPDEVKLILIDPKVVELSVYNGIPHLLIPVVTDPKQASSALHWGVAEMTDRYQKFADRNVRDLKGYNKKAEELRKKGDPNAPEILPQIVIIVDELADLMMVAPGEVEESICRLAQLARAAGIHLIIATQRPSVDVITGLIKANMPSRAAFAVSSGVDSRTILDMNGAEKLLGKGDMLFYPQGFPKPARVQGAFVSDGEVSDVVDYLKNQVIGNVYDDSILEKVKTMGSGSSAGVAGGTELDDYFEKAARFIIDKDKASIGMLQRFFKIGFNRAARIMDQLAEAGVVGEEEGTKPRKVLMSEEQFEQYIEECL